MRKILIIVGVMTSIIMPVKSGGLVTNSNQSASYYRMLARGASTTGDAVYYNPAGLVFLEEGLTISLNTQMIWMKRTINNDLMTLNKDEFEGNLYVPFFPGIYAAYKTGNWAFSLGFNPPAGGGSVEFKEGLPMLERDVSFIPGRMTSMGISTSNYSMQSMMKGSSIVYGIQAGASYKINEMLSVSVGVRMMLANNSYEGYVRDIRVNPNLESLGLPFPVEMLNAAELNARGDAIANIASNHPDPETAALLGAVAGGLKMVAGNIPDQTLDVSQSGNGIAPILGIHFKLNNLNLAAKYEFQTNITIKNETKQNAMNMYPDGQELRSDVPALLSLAGSYNIVPALKFSFTYLHHFEPQATLQSWAPDATNPNGGIIIERQKLIDGGTNEYMAGLEFNVGKLIVSAGCQYSDVSVSDAWHNDITHNLDNFTLGLGAAYNFGEKLSLNIGGLTTWYTPVSVKGSINSLDYTQTYDRTNKAIAIGIEYRF